jgi:hypothetical protein
MSIYKEFRPTDISLVDIKINKTQTLTSASNGIQSVQFRSGSTGLSGSYWDSIQLEFYLSGSAKSTEDSRFNNPFFRKGAFNQKIPQHLNKFHSSGSIISIPQKYFGEEIKRGSFTLIDDSSSSTITIKDDSYGNLYATAATITQSNASISSSDNYIGNIFYRNGIINITETGSYTPGVGYTDVSTGNYTLTFDSTQTIWVKEYTMIIEPNEFNITNNPTAISLISGSAHEGSTKITHSPFLKSKLTGSNWSPYMNTIGLYMDDDPYPVMVARYPQAIKMRDDIRLIFKIRQDF